MEGLDEWLLVQAKCEYCAHRPQHLTCEFQGKGQQVACIQHCREEIHKALVHCMAVHLPAEETVWCPMRFGKDLGHHQRSPQQLQKVASGFASPASGASQREREELSSILLPSKR